MKSKSKFQHNSCTVQRGRTDGHFLTHSTTDPVFKTEVNRKIDISRHQLVNYPFT